LVISDEGTLQLLRKLVIVCSSSREELFLEWAALVDRLRFSILLELAKEVYSTPFYVT
jgi:hypothetical protein